MAKGKCKKIRELDGQYLQGDLDPVRDRQVESHLAECPSCQKVFQETQDVLNLLPKDSLPDPGPVFWDTLSSRIITQVRSSRHTEKESLWYKKLWTNPFGWPGYAWATALILLLLTPAVVYQIYYQHPELPLALENNALEYKWEAGNLPLSAVVETLSDKESALLAKKVMSRMGKDLTAPNSLSVEDELHWDISRSLEGLTKQELEALIKKMEPGGSAGIKEEEVYVC
jgi:hypothetical protein